jgi:hypothetical protein
MLGWERIYCDAEGDVGSKVLTERIDEVSFAAAKNDFGYHPNYFLRALKELHIEFSLTPSVGSGQ